LVFFSGRRKSKTVGHVGIVVSAKEDGKFNFIHASVQNGVIISSSDEPYYLKRFIHAGRVISDDQMLAVVSDFSRQPNYISNTASGIISAPLLSPSTQTKKIIPPKYHRVKKGETLSSIALKYDLTIAELKQKNKIKNNKINPKQLLKVKDSESVLIVETNKSSIGNNSDLASNANISSIETPKENENKVEDQSVSSHIVKKGESLFSISHIYHISVEELKKINNLITTRIHSGQKVKLVQNTEATALAKVSSDNSRTEIKNTTTLKPEANDKLLTHKVKKGENLQGIAKENNISVEDIKRINHLTTDKIRFGQELKLISDSEPSDRPNKGKNNDKNATSKILHHKVKSGESFYSIAEKYNCKVNDLKEWNNKTGSKLNIGDKLVIYTKTN